MQVRWQRGNNMSNFAALFEKYDRLVLFDTETTGLAFSRDEIIEFAAVVVENRYCTSSYSYWMCCVCYLQV